MNAIAPGLPHRGCDLSGQRFGRLLVLSMAGRDAAGYMRWECRCDCGGKRVTRTGALTSGRTVSCGCSFLDQAKSRRTTYVHRNSRAYKAWMNMRNRCSNPNGKDWSHYGGRGITVCDLWQTFAGFYADMGDPPDGTSLDRIDNDRGYEPGNCRWATRNRQVRNTRATKVLTFDGRTQPLSDWADELGIKADTLHKRLRYGWSVEDALRAPLVEALS